MKAIVYVLLSIVALNNAQHTTNELIETRNRRNLASIPSGTLNCSGNNDCSGVSLTKSTVKCAGYLSCANSDVRANKLFVMGSFNSIESIDVDEEIHVFGPFSLLNSLKLNLAKKNYFYGAHMASSTISSNGRPYVYAEFGNFDIGSPIVTVTCTSGSKCEFVCKDCRNYLFYAEEDSDISINCIGGSSCSGVNLNYAGKALHLIGATAYSQITIVVPVRKLSETIEKATNLNLDIGNNSPNLHESDRRLKPSYFCYDKLECANNEFTDVEDSFLLLCDGFYSCKNVMVNNEALALTSRVFAYGYFSNVGAELKVGSITGMGYKSLKSASIVAQVLYVYGYRTLEDATITTIEGGSLNINAHSHNGLYGAKVICPKSTSCHIDCGIYIYGIYGSCENVDYVCTAVDTDCQVTCNEFSGCPRVYKQCGLYESEVDCVENKYCLYDSATGICAERNQEYCSVHETKASCLEKKKYCSWKKKQNLCFMKPSELP